MRWSCGLPAAPPSSGQRASIVGLIGPSKPNTRPPVSPPRVSAQPHGPSVPTTKVSASSARRSAFLIERSGGVPRCTCTAPEGGGGGTGPSPMRTPTGSPSSTVAHTDRRSAAGAPTTAITGSMRLSRSKVWPRLRHELTTNRSRKVDRPLRPQARTSPHQLRSPFARSRAGSPSTSTSLPSSGLGTRGSVAPRRRDDKRVRSPGHCHSVTGRIPPGRAAVTADAGRPDVERRRPRRESDNLDQVEQDPTRLLRPDQRWRTVASTPWPDELLVGRIELETHGEPSWRARRPLSRALADQRHRLLADPLSESRSAYCRRWR